MTSPPPKTTRSPGWRAVLTQAAMSFVGAAAFPRLAYRLRWPTRLGPRGLVAYIAANAASLFLQRQFVLPRMRRLMEEQERAREELRQELGREPTADEMCGRLGQPPDGG